MREKSQKDWFKNMYGLGIERPGWALEPDPHVKKFLDKIIGEEIKDGKILDLGCGQGRHALYCAERGLESYGIDYIERAINEAKQKAKEKNLTNAHFETGDILNLDFPENHFDIVVDSSVLDHVAYTDWTKYMDNILKVLKIGGFLILSEFSAKDKRLKEEPELYEHGERPFPESLFYKTQDHYDHYFQDSEIEKLFSDKFEISELYHAETPVICSPPERLMLNALLRRKR